MKKSHFAPEDGYQLEMIPTSTQEERNTPANKPMEQKFGVQPQELAVTDISKFFQQVFVRKSSYPLQFLVWRKVGNPTTPWLIIRSPG